jgi:hypothetical protein
MNSKQLSRVEGAAARIQVDAQSAQQLLVHGVIVDMQRPQ